MTLLGQRHNLIGPVGGVIRPISIFTTMMMPRWIGSMPSCIAIGNRIGTFMEPSAIILILAPILFPIAMQLGIDPIHLGIIMVVNMEIGLITPPTGLNLFVTSAVTGMPLTRVVRAVSPWLLVMLAFLILVTYVPFVSLALPNWLGM